MHEQSFEPKSRKEERRTLSLNFNPSELRQGDATRLPSLDRFSPRRSPDGQTQASSAGDSFSPFLH
jgi:hypothetical protein